MALLDVNGVQMPLTLKDVGLLPNKDVVLNITKASETFVFEGVTHEPVPSLLRGFCAPVKLDYGYTQTQLLFLASKDTDGFCRWEACQRLLIDAVAQAMLKPVGYQLELELVTMPVSYTHLRAHET